MTTKQIQVTTFILSTWNDALAEAMTDALNEGWEIMFPPQYLWTRVASGANVETSPHFLLTIRHTLPHR